MKLDVGAKKIAIFNLMVKEAKRRKEKRKKGKEVCMEVGGQRLGRILTGLGRRK